MPSRLACFYVPLFPLAARLRSEPDLRYEAVVIVEGNGNAAHVVAATRRARKGGIRPGLSLPQARAILPNLIARGRDTECERTAQEALLEIAESFSPRVEDADSGIAYLDIQGMEIHFGGSESGLAQAAVLATTSAGVPARVGIASSKLAARIAAEIPKTPVIVEPGHEKEFLAPLPLARLSPEIDIAATLSRWGIQSIGELAQLPEGEIATRLGETGRDLHFAARGIDPHPLVPRQLPPSFSEGMDLEWPLVALEPFLFVANAALERLTARLECRGYACTRLELTLKLDPDGFVSRAIELPAPTRDVKTLLTLTRLDLEAHAPGAPVAGFIFVAHPDQPRRAQLSLFGPPAMSPDKLATAIAKIASRIGGDRIGSPTSVDGHLPERFHIDRFTPPPPPTLRRRPSRWRGLLAVRVVRPPIELEVTTSSESVPSSTEDLLRMQLRSIRCLAPSHPKQKPLELSGSVRISSGPWRLEDSWWSDTPAARDYWDVELTSGDVCRVYRDRGSGGWFIDGMYD